MKVNIFIMTIFYIILTAFFLYIFIREKSIAKKISVYRDKFSEKIIGILKIKNEKTAKNIKKFVNISETLITAVILVLILQRFYIGNFKIPTGSMIPTIEVGDRVFADMVTYKFSSPKRDSIIVFKEPMENKLLFTKRVMALPGEKIKIENGRLYIDGKEFKTREYSNLGIENKEWIVPKKGDKLEIIPAGDYVAVYKKYNLDIDKIQNELTKNAIAYSDVVPNLKFLVNGQETGMILDFLHDKKIVEKIMNGESVELTLDEDYFLALGDNTMHSFDSRMWGFVAKHRIRGRALVRFWPLNRIGIVK